MAKEYVFLLRAYIIVVKVFIRQLSKEMIGLHDAPGTISTFARARRESN
jgi:hypothetical protein